MSRPNMRSWIAVLLSLVMVFSVVAPTFASTGTPVSSEDAITLLQELGIVQGDEQGNLNLEKTITRAELAKIATVSLGNASLAPYLAPQVRFADTKGHWAAGYVELAARLGLVKGRDEATFDPGAPITYGEVFTVILRMLEREPAGLWNGETIMRTASDLGLAPSSVGIAGLPAARGVVFEGLGRGISTVPLKDGQTIAQKHFKIAPPVLTLDPVATATADEKVTISGTTDARSVTVSGLAARLSSGRFSADVPLQMGTNVIKVVATGRIGDETVKSVEITRGGDVTSISVSGPEKVKAGESVVLDVRPKDAAGRTLPASLLNAKVGDNNGSVDLRTSTFRAGSKAGPTTISFTYGEIKEEFSILVTGPAAEAKGLRVRPSDKAPTAGKSTTVAVEVLNQDGALLNYDEGRTVTLSSASPSVSISPTSAQTTMGVATFTVSATTEGEYELTARSTGLTESRGYATFATSTRVVLKAEPIVATADGATPITIRAVLENEQGTPVNNNTNDDIAVRITDSSDESWLTADTMIIRRGTSTSTGWNASLVPGLSTELVRVSGKVTSSHTLTVVPATVQLNKIVIGSAANIDILGGGVRAQANTPLNLTLRVTDKDGNAISNAAVAFQIKVTTSNEEEIVDGKPVGVNLTLGKTTLMPLVGYSNAVVGRTRNGLAQIQLDYHRSGQVKIEVVPMAATEDSFDDEGAGARATSASGLKGGSRTITFSLGESPEDHLQALIDLPTPNLVNQEYAVLPANARGTSKVKVRVLDSADGWVSTATGTVTLSCTTCDNTRLVGSATATLREGVAEFTINSTTTPGSDTWVATYQKWAGDDTKKLDIPFFTYNTEVEKPEILNIYGESGVPNRVLSTDRYMGIEIANMSGYGFVKVYRMGSSNPVYTSPVLNLASDPSVHVPKEVLAASDRYYVVVHNGYSNAKSDPWPSDRDAWVISEKPLKINISRVRYNAANRMLTVTASGVSTAGRIDPSLLTLRSTTTGEWESLATADCKLASGTFTCELPFDLQTDLIHGSVQLETKSGWFVRDKTGESASADESLSDNLMSPAAYIRYATVEFGSTTYNNSPRVTATLTLHGVNLDQGSIYLSKLTVAGFKMGTNTAPRGSSSQVTIKVPDYTNTTSRSDDDSIAAKLKAMVGPNITLDTETGWLTNGSDQNGGFLGVPVFASVRVTKLAYSASDDKLVIWATGLEGQVDPNKLQFLDRRGNVIEELSFTGYAPATPVDGRVEIQLNPAHAKALEENKGADGLPYKGNVYLTSAEPSPASGSWFTNESGWYASAFPRLRVSW